MISAIFFPKCKYKKIKLDVFVKQNSPDNGQFQRWSRSQDISLGHKDNYLDTSRKILSQEMLNDMCNMNALIFTIKKLLSMSILKKKRSNVKVKRFSTNKKVLSQGILM